MPADTPEEWEAIPGELSGTGYDEKRSIELEYSFALLGTSCKNGKRYRDDNP